jgi:hypothetical protein
MANRPAPGVVANSLVRYLLTRAGSRQGGLNPAQLQQTLATFGDRCAYTGELLTTTGLEYDHAVPMNRQHGGLHVFGNVLPATPRANREKGGLRYDDFLRSKGERFGCLAHLSDEQREEAIRRIEDFLRQTPAAILLQPQPQLLSFYSRQYDAARQLCLQAGAELDELLDQLGAGQSPAESDAAQDLPSNEQLELEEQDALPSLPEPYATIQAQGQQTGVGAYAQAVFGQLFADGRIAHFLPNLTYREDSFAAFKLSFPALITQRTGDSTVRYYATPYRHQGTEYYLCSQWTERHRDYLDAWVTEHLG